MEIHCSLPVLPQTGFLVRICGVLSRHLCFAFHAHHFLCVVTAPSPIPPHPQLPHRRGGGGVTKIPVILSRLFCRRHAHWTCVAHVADPERYFMDCLGARGASCACYAQIGPFCGPNEK